MAVTAFRVSVTRSAARGVEAAYDPTASGSRPHAVPFSRPLSRRRRRRRKRSPIASISRAPVESRSSSLRRRHFAGDANARISSGGRSLAAGTMVQRHSRLHLLDMSSTELYGRRRACASCPARDCGSRRHARPPRAMRFTIFPCPCGRAKISISTRYLLFGLREFCSVLTVRCRSDCAVVLSACPRCRNLHQADFIETGSTASRRQHRFHRRRSGQPTCRSPADLIAVLLAFHLRYTSTARKSLPHP